MTILDEHCSDVLDATSDHDLERLVLDLDALGTGSPSPMGDMIIRHALAAHAQDVTQHGSSRPADEIVGRQRRWARRVRRGSSWQIRLSSYTTVMITRETSYQRRVIAQISENMLPFMAFVYS